MATGKRYYWMKLKESFMTSDTIDYFMSQPSGANYVVLYQMLCLKTINTDGRLSRQIGEVIIPYDISKIQRDLKWFSADTIRGVRAFAALPQRLPQRREKQRLRDRELCLHANGAPSGRAGNAGRAFVSEKD